jgi:4a-hydroxytetrahydrobiopterin dehydratase
VADAEGHHPDLHLRSYNHVAVELSTHAVGGLTENDFIMAAKINEIPLDDLLPKRKPQFWA